MGAVIVLLSFLFEEVLDDLAWSRQRRSTSAAQAFRVAMKFGAFGVCGWLLYIYLIGSSPSSVAQQSVERIPWVWHGTAVILLLYEAVFLRNLFRRSSSQSEPAPASSVVDLRIFNRTTSTPSPMPTEGNSLAVRKSIGGLAIVFAVALVQWFNFST